jgi:RNA polymerase sigma-70 factor (ECF subfamily)
LRFSAQAAKDFSPSRKYASEDAQTNEAPGVAADNHPSLMTALKGRDCSAWSAAVDRYLPKVYGFVFHLVGGDRTLAEELNQEAWLEAIRGIDQCDAARGTFRNWLFGIARRRVALYFRRRAVAGSPTMFSDQCEECVEWDGGSVLPEDVLEQVERASVVRAAMLLLPSDRRQVLVWKYVQGLSVEAIAVRMGRTDKAVESLLSRAREQMRALLCGYVMPLGDGQQAVNGSSHE